MTMMRGPYRAILQFELPSGEINTESIGVFNSRADAYDACQRDADKCHGVKVWLKYNKSDSSDSETCFAVYVRERLDTTEWYVIKEGV